MTPGTEPFPGIEVTGWGSHDKLVPPDSHPPELLEEIRRKYGESPIRTDEYGRASLPHLRELHAELVNLTRRSAELARWLLQRPWNLGIVVFGALHRGGHRFWDRSSVEGDVPTALGPWYDSALHELYRTADRAVGDLVAAAPGAAVFVFSLHGMRVNSARVDFLDEMLSRVLHGPTATRSKPGLLRRAGEAMPLPLRRALTNSVPQALKNRIMTRWTTGGVKWEQTPAFTLRADLNGYIRLNIRGREPTGVVRPDEVDALSARIIEGLQSFRDATTGEPLIEEVCRAIDVFPKGERIDRLPDLIVRWHPSSGAPHEAVSSPRFGRIERSTPGRIPNGRSGNHTPEGFSSRTGPGSLPAGSSKQEPISSTSRRRRCAAWALARACRSRERCSPSWFSAGIDGQPDSALPSTRAAGLDNIYGQDSIRTGGPERLAATRRASKSRSWRSKLARVTFGLRSKRSPSRARRSIRAARLRRHLANPAAEMRIRLPLASSTVPSASSSSRRSR